MILPKYMGDSSSFCLDLSLVSEGHILTVLIACNECHLPTCSCKLLKLSLRIVHQDVLFLQWSYYSKSQMRVTFEHGTPAVHKKLSGIIHCSKVWEPRETLLILALPLRCHATQVSSCLTENGSLPLVYSGTEANADTLQFLNLSLLQGAVIIPTSSQSKIVIHSFSAT